MTASTALNKTPRRVLILNHNLRERGTYFRAWKMAEGFRDRGDDVTFITTGEQYYRTRRKREHGIAILETPCFAIAHGHDGGWLPIALCARLYHVLIHMNYDVVYTFSHKPVDVLPAFACRLLHGSKWIADWCDLWGGEGLHGLMRNNRGTAKTWSDSWNDFITKLDSRLELYVAKNADRLTVISSDLARRAGALRKDSATIHLLESGADTERIPVLEKPASREAFGLPQNAPLLGYMTSWYPDEAFTLEALRLVLQARPDAHVAIAGPPLSNQTEILSQEPLKGRVTHCGRLPFAQVPEFLAACDVLLMPLQDTAFNRSRWPNKIGDYLAAGRPQVACAVGDVGPFLDGAEAAGKPLGIKTDSTPEDFARGIVELLNTPERWETLGKNARAFAETERSWQTIRSAFFAWL